MVKRYQMDGGQLPTIPTPHDGIVTQIDIDNDCIVFRFENEIAVHDAVRTICPDAKSLTIRYHLTQYKFFFFTNGITAYGLFSQRDSTEKLVPGN